MPGGHFRQSAYLQQSALFLGQEQTFSYASELLERFSGIVLSDKQIENLCHHYGQCLEGQSIDNLSLDKRGQLHYAMVDGSYLMSREEGWIETKLGRIFKADDCLCISDKRSQIKTSRYVAHIGSHKSFCEKLSPHLDRLSRVVFIADGAAWIWKWVQDFYPDSVQILDFYHAYEKLCQWAVLVFKDQSVRQCWLQDMKELLLDDQLEEVMLQIQDRDCKGENVEKKTALLSYFNNNRHRMLYGRYLEAGYLIGSGAIESANRHVIQQRMKRSGQRWTIQGGQQVLNLRTAKLSNDWKQVVNLVRQAA